MAQFRDNDGKQYCRSTKIAHAPVGHPGATRDELKALKEEHEQLAKECAVKMEQAVRGKLTDSELDDSIRSLQNRANRLSCTISIVEFVVEWIMKRACVVEPAMAFAAVNRYCTAFDDFFAFVGEERCRTNLGAVDKEMVRKFSLQFEESHKLKGGSLKTYLQVLSTPFAEAKKSGLISRNPVFDYVDTPDKRNAEKVNKRDSKSRKRLPFTEEEVKRILDMTLMWGPLGREWRTAIIAAIYTGARQGDAVRLQRKNFDLQGKEVHFSPSKNQRQMRILNLPLHRVLCAHLVDLFSTLPDDPEAYICPTLAFRESGSLSKSFRLLMEYAGVDCMEITQGPDRRRFGRKCFHALRHTIVHWLQQGRVPRELRMKIVGQSSAEVHEGYCSWEIDLLRKSVDVLPVLVVPESTPGDLPSPDFSI